LHAAPRCCWTRCWRWRADISRMCDDRSWRRLDQRPHGYHGFAGSAAMGGGHPARRDLVRYRRTDQGEPVNAAWLVVAVVCSSVSVSFLVPRAMRSIVSGTARSRWARAMRASQDCGRYQANYHPAYMRDPDGNKVAAVCHTQAECSATSSSASALILPGSSDGPGAHIPTHGRTAAARVRCGPRQGGITAYALGTLRTERHAGLWRGRG
jgi:hypothetical protein